MALKGPFYINGTEYSRKEMQDFALMNAESKDTPGWEKEIFKFISSFLDISESITQITSGTTGSPKDLILKKSALVRSAQKTIEHFRLKPGERVLSCLPVEYIAGKMMIVRAFEGSLDLITVKPGGRPLKELQSPVRFAAMVPLQLYDSIKFKDSLELIDTLIIGGGEISTILRRELLKIKDTKIFETFAMSETASHFAARRINGEKADQLFGLLSGVRIGSDRRGCLVVDVEGVTDKPVTTNDLVSIEGEDRFEWLGRIDNIIISGGKKIIPEILEEKIGRELEQEVAVTGIKDEKLGEKIVLAVENRKLKSVPDHWYERLSDILEKHEVPKEIIILSEFPRNRSMKIERSNLCNLLNP